MRCRRKQQDGWELLVCESWVIHRVEASEESKAYVGKVVISAGFKEGYAIGMAG